MACSGALGNQLGIVLPSFKRDSMSPAFQHLSRHSKQLACSQAFEFRVGFCSNSEGRVIAAVIAMDSSSDPCA